MKVALVQSPCWTVNTPPYNLALLKAACEQNGNNAVCLDLNIKFYQYLLEKREQNIYDNPTNWFNDFYVREIILNHSDFIDRCVNEILALNPGVIGFTLTGLNRAFSEEIMQRIKNKDKDKVIIIGGPNCFRSEDGGKLLNTNRFVDALCYLEGEEVLPRFLDMVEKSNKITHLNGIAFREGKSEVVSCRYADLIKDLNSLPFADYSDFCLQEYAFEELPISTSRGCINRCVFCCESMVWELHRFRTAENVFAEIKYQKSRYPHIKSFFFNDSLINGNIKMLDNLCDLLIKNKVNVYWGGQAAIREEMTKEFIMKMKRAGLSHVSYGLESASQRILKLMGKRFTTETAERVIRDTKSAGIRTDVNIIIGFPTERAEDIIATANFLARNRDYIDEIFFHPLVISSGSYLYEHREDFGIRFHTEHNPNSWYSLKEENTLEKRLEMLEFYKRNSSGRGESFFTLTDYYLFVADDYSNKGQYKDALAYYLKSKNLNNNRFKDEFIKQKIETIQDKLCKELN